MGKTGTGSKFCIIFDRFLTGLHHAIFDAVVDHLDEMARTALAHERCAGRAVGVPGGDRQEDGADLVPYGPVAAGHYRGAMARTLLSARDADAEEAPWLRFGQGGAAVGIGEVGVAAIDDDVALFKQRLEHGDLFVHRRAGRDHEDELARAGDGRDEGLQTGRGHDQGRQCAGASHELVRARGGAVEHGDAMSLFGDVQRECRAHGSQADQADFRILVHRALLLCSDWQAIALSRRSCRHPGSDSIIAALTVGACHHGIQRQIRSN